MMGLETDFRSEWRTPALVEYTRLRRPRSVSLVVDAALRHPPRRAAA